MFSKIFKYFSIYFLKYSFRYRISNAMIPSFLKPTEAQKILLVGKSINFLREVCRQPLSEFQIPSASHYGELENDLSFGSYWSFCFKVNL